jgi:exodeoxyribonuclease (lambda-induced)
MTTPNVIQLGNLLVYTDPQGSDEWLDSRRGVITGSRYKDCRDYNKLTAAELKEGKTRGKPSDKLMSYAMDVAYEICGGVVEAGFVSKPMKIGSAEEPVARNALEVEQGYVVNEAGFITTADRRFGVSVDGLVGDDGMIEIKTMVSSKTLFRAVARGDYSEYVDQVNGALWLLGRQWCDLVLWSPRMAAAGKKGLHIHRIHRDDNAINELERDLLQFRMTVDSLVSELMLKVA